MEFALSETQKMLRQAARDFITDACPKSVVREAAESDLGFPPELWRQTAAMGWTSIIFPEAYGGDDLSVADLAVIYEEMGRALFPGPHLTSVVLSGLTLQHVGNDAQKERFLKGIASGETIFSLALNEPDYGWEPGFISTRAVPQDADYLLSGTKLYVPYAGAADHLLLAARTAEGATDAGINLFIVDSGSPGVTRQRLQGSIGEPLYEVVLDNVRVAASALVGEVGQGWAALRPALDAATVLQCAEVVGGVAYLLQITVAYANERVQFGQLIGSYQRIQDRVINIVNDLDKARWAAAEAAWRLSEGLPARLEISIAKVLANRAYASAGAEAAHVFAGPGFSREFDLWLYHRRAWMADHFLGNTARHRDIVAEELLDA